MAIGRGRGARGRGDDGAAAGGGARDQMWWRWNIGAPGRNGAELGDEDGRR